MKNEKTLEIVRIRPKTGVEVQHWLEVMDEVQSEFLEKQPGYLRRSLWRLDDESWVDLVEWRSREEADSAMEKSMDCEAVKKIGDMADMESMSVAHGKLAVSYGE